ncbi:hypothetical protein PQU92_06765 [Asticcacaulis sp. BYS171W]|uniref:Beta-lactamase-inhibitor-like PepSY-like domain-containing protein n=1 Tax=Asticcacaulis aquaticus TaxID=2984212 RepID=A0ABT5HT01_9CAUL|nr:hypothetical protein [Asticcacaulis aquaticus]MDC7682970.1 hypothetical protein [Asticcacaulis aquaticus]
MKRLLPLAVTLVLTACSPAAEPPQEPTQKPPESPPAAVDLPEGVRSAAIAAIPGLTIAEFERKEREGRVYYDVEGTRPDGSAVELDLLQEGEAYKVVEIQRDIDWATAPALVRAAVKGLTPVRVIESTQTDAAVIYELFAEGKPEKPSLEVRWKDGQAQVLKEEWPH